MAISPERQTRLVQLAYLVLPPKSGRHHRARVAHAEVEQVLAGADRAADGRSPEALYELLRGRVIARALTGGASRGLRAALGAGAGDGGGAARDEALARLTPPARAAYALRHLEGLDAAQTVAALTALAVPDPATAVKLAEQHGPDPACLKTLEVPGPGMLRRRKAVASVGVVALVLPGVLLLGGGGSDGTQADPTVGQIQDAAATDAAAKRQRPKASTVAEREKLATGKAARAGGTSNTVKRTAVTKPTVTKPAPDATAVDSVNPAAAQAAKAARAAEAKAAAKVAAKAKAKAAAKAAAEEAAAKAAAKKKAAAQRAADPALEDAATPAGSSAPAAPAPAPTETQQIPEETRQAPADEIGGVPADQAEATAPAESEPPVPQSTVPAPAPAPRARAQA